MNVNTIRAIPESVINRVCDIRDEFASNNDVYRRLTAKHNAAWELVRAATPGDKLPILLNEEETAVEADAFLQEALYIRGLLDGMNQAGDDGRNIGKSEQSFENGLIPQLLNNR